METKVYLGQVQRLDKMIQNKVEDLYTLESLACSAGSINYDKDCVQTTKDPDKIGKVVAKIIDMQSEKEGMISAYLDRRKTIEHQIENVPNTELYDVLYQKFILGKPLEKIAKDNYRSLSQVKRYYGKALKVFEEMYGEMYLREDFDLYFRKRTEMNRNEP